MAKTYAYLKDTKVDDDAITKLNVAVLRIMLLHRLLKLMPEACRTCNETSFFERTQVPMVRCSRCSKGACGECYPSDVRASTISAMDAQRLSPKALVRKHLTPNCIC